MVLGISRTESQVRKTLAVYCPKYRDQGSLSTGGYSRLVLVWYIHTIFRTRATKGDPCRDYSSHSHWNHVFSGISPSRWVWLFKLPIQGLLENSGRYPFFNPELMKGVVACEWCKRFIWVIQEVTSSCQYTLELFNFMKRLFPIMIRQIRSNAWAEMLNFPTISRKSIVIHDYRRDRLNIPIYHQFPKGSCDSCFFNP